MFFCDITNLWVFKATSNVEYSIDGCASKMDQMMLY